MFSEMIREALGREVIGQTHAINSVVRGVTRLASKMTPLERSWCAYLFVGSPGTGRSHLVRSLARILYGDEVVLTLNCNAGGHPDPWMEFVHQLAPLLADGPPAPPQAPSGMSLSGMPPPRLSRSMRIILVQHLERARKELFPQLARALETGQVSMPDGKRLTLNDCMFFFTSGLCADQILDQSSRIGFSGATREDDEEEMGQLYKICREEAENVFGLDLLVQFDNLIVFRQLEENHRESVLERHFARMSRWLERRGIRSELEPSAKEYLLSLAAGRPQLGAHELIRAHRREVEFPVADLLLSNALEPGGFVSLDHLEGDAHLHLTVQPREEENDATCPGGAGLREVPVTA